MPPGQAAIIAIFGKPESGDKGHGAVSA